MTHPTLDHFAEGFEEVVVDEGLLANLAVLAVVLPLRTRHAETLEHHVEDVGKQTIAVVGRVRLAHVLNHLRVDGGHAPGTQRVLDADRVSVVKLVPINRGPSVSHQV